MKNVLAVIGLLLFTGIAAADDRWVDGKPCYPTEKTYYDADGVTPYMCRSASGPAYSFQVFVDKKLLWDAKLPSDKPEVYFDLPVTSEAEQKLTPRLIVRRDLGTDPTGAALFFGEVHLAAIKRFTGGGNSMEVPEFSHTGKTFPITQNESTFNIGTLPGTVFSENNYRIVVRRETSKP